MPTVRKQTANRKKTTRRKKTGVLDRISDIEAHEGIKMCVYGGSGTGKTRFWSTFPKPILAIIVSGGNRPGELRSIDTPENRKSIKKIELENTSEITELVSYIKEEDAFQTVVLDHVSGLQDLVMQEVLGLEEIPIQKSWGMASQQDYAQVALQTKTMLRTLLSLEGNVVIVGQERSFGEESETSLIVPYVAAAVQPSVVGWLNPAVDHIGQMFKRRQTITKEVKVGKKVIKKKTPTDVVEYCLRTGAHEVYTTKFRVPIGHKVPDAIVDPTYDKITSMLSDG